MYMYAAMADLVAEFDDPELKRTLETLWADVTTKQMYVTGGLGPSKHNEGFTKYYDLPNDTAYAETCASVALIFWAQRMLNIDLDGAYADVLERALYNGALSGLSRDGEHYFYENPLESDGTHRRWRWHTCPCCTMNVSRLVASIAGYFYSTGDDTLAVHLYGGASTTVSLGGRSISLHESSAYPWDGTVRLAIDPEAPSTFCLRLRIPGWARGASARINGEAVDVAASVSRGYLPIRREWAAGDVVDLDLPMPVDRIYAHPKVKSDIGRVALRRGPLIYCVERADNPATPVDLLRLPRDATLTVHKRSDLFGGSTVITADGAVASTRGWSKALYQNAPPRRDPHPFTAIPYYLWNNREPGPMTVWLPEA
jgi:uncharacterized protein